MTVTSSSAAAAAVSPGDTGLDSLTSIPVSPALPVSGSLSTNAVTRNFSDLHAPTWFGLLSANIAARTVLFHPIQLAISRKRLTRESAPPTVWGLMKAAYRGGRTSAYGATSTTGHYNFGQGGVRGVYRGVGAALLCNLVGETSYLFTLEAIKEYVANPKAREAGEGAMSSSAALSGLPDSDVNALFTASSSSAAVGAMCGDFVALLLVTPLVIVCNRQMTAGYGMAASNTYTTIPRTLRSVWGMYQDPGQHSLKQAASSAMGSSSSQPQLSSSLSRVTRGFSGLYQGLSAGLLRIPSSGCWWGLYTKSKEAVYTVAAPTLARWEQEQLEKSAAAAEMNGDRSGSSSSSATPPPSFWQQNWCLSPTDNPLLNALAGILASVSTTLIFNPIAVIQTRQQSLPPHFWVEQAATTAAAPVRTWKTSLPFRRVFHVANDLVRKEGLRGFFKGAPANISVAVMDGIIFTLLFEFTKLGSDVQFLEQRSTESAARSDMT